MKLTDEILKSITEITSPEYFNAFDIVKHAEKLFNGLVIHGSITTEKGFEEVIKYSIKAALVFEKQKYEFIQANPCGLNNFPKGE